MAHETLKDGDVVILNSGGPEMTVTKIVENTKDPEDPGINVVYFENDKIITRGFRRKLLTKVRSGDTQKP